MQWKDLLDAARTGELANVDPAIQRELLLLKKDMAAAQEQIEEEKKAQDTPNTSTVPPHPRYLQGRMRTAKDRRIGAKTFTMLTTKDSKWMMDKYATNCKNCGKEFGFWRRKYHCRCCGYIFCGSCSFTTLGSESSRTSSNDKLWISQCVKGRDNQEFKYYFYTVRTRLCGDCMRAYKYCRGATAMTGLSSHDYRGVNDITEL